MHLVKMANYEPMDRQLGELASFWALAAQSVPEVMLASSCLILYCPRARAQGHQALPLSFLFFPLVFSRPRVG